MDRTRFGASRCAETTGISVKSSSWKENSLIASDLLRLLHKRLEISSQPP